MKKLLLVDDNFDFVQLLAEILGSYFEVITAFSVKSAQEVLQNRRVDIICSDFYMRDGTGADLFQFAKMNCPGVAFIILSGSDPLQKSIILDSSCECWSKTDNELLKKFKELSKE